MRDSRSPRYGTPVQAQESLDWIGSFMRRLKDLERERDDRFLPLHLMNLTEFCSICLDFEQKAQELANDSRASFRKYYGTSLSISSALQDAKDRGWDHFRQTSGRQSTESLRGINHRRSWSQERIVCSCCFEEIAISKMISCTASTPDVSSHLSPLQLHAKASPISSSAENALAGRPRRCSAGLSSISICQQTGAKKHFLPGSAASS